MAYCYFRVDINVDKIISKTFYYNWRVTWISCLSPRREAVEISGHIEQGRLVQGKWNIWTNLIMKVRLLLDTPNMTFNVIYIIVKYIYISYF